LTAENEAAVQPAADTSAGGQIIERVMPDVPPSARNTIQGTVRVTVRVDVDRSGEVQFAELENRGPSKYFSTLAMQAAQHWGFRPPKVAGQSILSTWTLRFEFTRAGTTVIPTQVSP
jgi:TonB family protein